MPHHTPRTEQMELQVCGSTTYRENRWREAVLEYLFGIWSGDAYTLSRPKIRFGSFTLRLHQKGFYYGYGVSPDAIGPEYAAMTNENTIRTSNSHSEVEQALVRFVKNNRIRFLHIGFAPLGQGYLFLWKKAGRGEIGCLADGIPETHEAALIRHL